MSTFSLFRKFKDNPLKRHFNKRWSAWLSRRLPPQRQVVLDRKRIFILPTGMGLAYLVTGFLLFLAGVNYDNNLLLNFSFFLASLFVVAILQTFSNLSGLVITAGNSEPAFAGSEAKFNIQMSKSGSKDHHSIQCSWEQYESVSHNLLRESLCPVEMLLQTNTRGRFKPGRIKIQSVYPLGLCRSWTWVDLDMDCLVYPKPIAADVPQQSSMQQTEGSAHSHDGNEDFDGLRAYRHSDSLRTVDWKSFARRGTLLTKEFHGYQSRSFWIDWNQLTVGDVEFKLSVMCFLVLEMAKINQEYGLSLPGLKIPPNKGKTHQTACLEALAGF